MKVKRKSKHFPRESTLRRMREKLSDPNFEGNLAPPAEASVTDRSKYMLCQMIAVYKREHEMLQKDIARRIGVDESRVSDILRGKIESFTLDRLIAYAEKLHPGIKLKISAA